MAEGHGGRTWRCELLARGQEFAASIEKKEQKMKWITWLAMVLAVVFLAGAPAAAKITAYASFDVDTGDPDTDFGWDDVSNGRFAPEAFRYSDPIHPFTAEFATHSDSNPFYDGPSPGSGVVNPWVRPTTGAHGIMKRGSIGPGKFGSGMDLTLAGNPGGSGVPSMLQEYNFQLQDPNSNPPWQARGSVRGVHDDEGTIEFWFKPDWDPATDTALRPIITGAQGGTRAYWNLEWGNGEFFTSNFLSHDTGTNVGHAVTGTLLNDWNHIAFAWNAAGNMTFLNSAIVGQTVYGPGDEKVKWADQPNFFMACVANCTSGSLHSDGFYDELIFRDNAIPEPASLALLGLGGIMMGRRRR